jgi:hypothetical protein
MAERYIQLRTKCAPPSWGDTAIRFNEMVLGPLLTLFLCLVGSYDLFMILSTLSTAYTSWSEWEEYHFLRSEFQRMTLMMNVTGGPQIATNDPTYYPYVIADAIARLALRRPDLQ